MGRQTITRFLTAVCLAQALVAAGPTAARQVQVASITELVDACQSALPGDSILVAPGTYLVSGMSSIGIAERPGPVLVRGATGVPQDVTVRGAGQDASSVLFVFNLEDSPHWTFEALTTSSTYYHGFKFDHGSTDCVVRNVIMRDHGQSGVKGTSDPPSGRYPDRLLVEHCDIGFTSPEGGTRSVVEGIDGVGVNDWIIRHNRFVNVQMGGGPAYGVFTKGNSSNTIIEGNVFEDCFIGASFGGGGTGASYFRDFDTTYEHRGGIIRNNIFIRATDAGVYVNKGHECKIYNNTLFECVLTIQLRFPESSGWVRNNLVKRSPSNPNEPTVRLRNGATALADEANSTASDSDFVGPSGQSSDLDLHLDAGSSKIDAGVDVGPDVLADADGDPRPTGSGFDIGADEFVLTTEVAESSHDTARHSELEIVPSIVRRGKDARVLLPSPDPEMGAIFNAAGRKVMIVRFTSGGASARIPLSTLLPGVYWLRVLSGPRPPMGKIVVLP